MDHATDIRLGWELDQTSDEDNSVTYWNMRLYPYAYGELDWKPFLNFNTDAFKFYSELNGIFEDFKVGVFAQSTLWWDWTAVGSNTRKVCVAAGWAFETITTTMTTQTYIYDCYKTILSNLLDPAAAFTNPDEKFLSWTDCGESDQIDAPLFEYSWFADSADQEGYWIGEAISESAATGCTAALFTNPIAASVFDIVVSEMMNGNDLLRIGSPDKIDKKAKKAKKDNKANKKSK